MLRNSDFKSVSLFVLRHSLCGLPFQYLLLDFFMPERTQKPVEPAPWGPKQGDGGGPRSPDISRPDTKDLLKKCARSIPTNPSAIASARVSNGTLTGCGRPEFFWRHWRFPCT